MVGVSLLAMGVQAQTPARTVTVTGGPEPGNYIVVDTPVSSTLSFHYIAHTTTWENALLLCPLIDPSFTTLAHILNDNEWNVSNGPYTLSLIRTSPRVHKLPSRTTLDRSPGLSRCAWVYAVTGDSDGERLLTWRRLRRLSQRRLLPGSVDRSLLARAGTSQRAALRAYVAPLPALDLRAGSGPCQCAS
jgi:hypothetical protein